MSALAHTVPATSVAAGWQSNGKRQKRCRRPGRVTPVPPSEAGFRHHCGCAPAPPNASGPPSSAEKSQVQGLLTQTNTRPKAVTFGRPGSRGKEKTPACGRWAQLLWCCTCCSCKMPATALASGDHKICSLPGLRDGALPPTLGF